MTKIFKGKITGNNLRRDYKFNQNPMPEPEEIKTSVVEFSLGREPFRNQSFVQYEIDGFYPIGSKVQIEMSIFEIEP